jgi:diguanylate cyclase
MLSNTDRMTSLLQQVRDWDVHLAIDDFGTGYCSLSYLSNYRFSRLKIDQSFVRNVPSDSRSANLTTAIINMGKTLDMKVIAECVETEDQMEFLRSRACDEIQGYYFSRPLSASAFAEKFRSHRPMMPSQAA